MASSIFAKKFDRREGFHQPLLTYDTQITVCPVFFYPAKMSSVGFYFNSLILSPRLALNFNLLLCRIAFCRAARATPCHTTPPLSCHATVSLLALHLSCAGWLLHHLLSCCATISLAPAIC